MPKGISTSVWDYSYTLIVCIAVGSVCYTEIIWQRQIKYNPINHTTHYSVQLWLKAVSWRLSFNDDKIQVNVSHNLIRLRLEILIDLWIVYYYYRMLMNFYVTWIAVNFPQIICHLYKSICKQEDLSIVKRIFGHALCTIADGHFGPISPRQCNVDKKDVQRKWKIKKYINGIYTRWHNESLGRHITSHEQKTKRRFLKKLYVQLQMIMTDWLVLISAE